MDAPIQIRAGGRGRLIVVLPYAPERVAKIKTVPGRRWHAEEEYWTVPHTDGMEDPLTVTAEEVRAYLLHLAEDVGVSASYRNQAISALKFLYRRVLRRPELLSAVPRRKSARPYRWS